MSITSVISNNRAWLVMGALMLLPGIAMASGTGTDGLPYEAGLKKLVDSMTGPVAFAISVIGVIAAGAMLIFGGDMNGFMRSIVFLVLVIGLIVGASSLLTQVFGSAGAVVDVGTGIAAPLITQGLC